MYILTYFYFFNEIYPFRKIKALKKKANYSIMVSDINETKGCSKKWKSEKLMLIR